MDGRDRKRVPGAVDDRPGQDRDADPGAGRGHDRSPAGWFDLPSAGQVTSSENGAAGTAGESEAESETENGAAREADTREHPADA